MSLQIETLFTAALGLQAPWRVEKVELNTVKRRIDFEVVCDAQRLICPHCGLPDQGVHDRVRKSWRHLDFFQFEAWLHAQVPRVHCAGCGKTTQLSVPWAREGSGFTLLFEALALSLCQDLPVAQAASQLRVQAHRLWRRIQHYVGQARAQDDMSSVSHIGIDETSVRRGQDYITVVHDLQAKRLLFATPGRSHETVAAFTQDLQAHGGNAAQIEHVCMDMSAAYRKGVEQSLPEAAISFDRYHVAALAGQAMDEVRSTELRQDSAKVRQALDLDAKTRRSLRWAMRTNHRGWSTRHRQAMYALQRSGLKSARAWQLKEALRQVYEAAAQGHDEQTARDHLQRWLSWATRSRLEPFKKLARTLKSHVQGVINGMLDKRSNAYVEAMNGLLQQAKRAARGFRTTENFITIAYLRMSKLHHLPLNPFAPAVPREFGVIVHHA
jgi:transposase